MKNEMIKQFMKATMVETTLVILITALKVLNPTFAKADPPTPGAPLTRMDVNTIPAGRHPAPPMIELSAAGEHVISSGPRLIIGMRFHGINSDDANLPFLGTRYFVVSAEVGMGTHMRGGGALSRIKLNITPVQLDTENDRLDYLNIAPVQIRFERELSVGLMERIQATILGVQMGSNDEYSRPTDEEIASIYHLFHFSLNAIGVEFQRLAGEPGVVSQSSGWGLHLGSAHLEIGFGARLTQGWTIEWLLQGSAGITPSQDLNATSMIDPTTRIGGYGGAIDTQLAAEIRIRFNDQVGYTRMQGFIRGQYRRNDSYLNEDGDGERIRRPSRSAASILAGIRVGF